MRVLVTGACGFVGCSLVESMRQHYDARQMEIVGIDNLSRGGVYLNVEKLQSLDATFVHGDVRVASDLDQLVRCDWVIDAAANASVLAGTNGNSSRAIVENNLGGTLQLLETCKRWSAGLILLSTSRVYALEELCNLPLQADAAAFQLDARQPLPTGASPLGIAESFSNAAPISLYGATKLASEQMALEYSLAFNFPVWINRCGVMAGAGQFGRADQGIFAFWLHSWLAKRPLRYIGFDGMGHQVRDCLHPKDLFLLIDMQIHSPRSASRIVNVSGGIDSARSLAQLSLWCRDRWGEHIVQSDAHPRSYDVPWLVLDSSLAAHSWNWQTTVKIDSVLDEIAMFAEQNPNWLEVSAG